MKSTCSVFTLMVRVNATGIETSDLVQYGWLSDTDARNVVQ